MKNNVALITGGAGFIGSEVAHLLAQKGVQLVLLDKNQDRSRELARSLQSDYNIPVMTMCYDLLDKETFIKVRNDIQSNFGKLDYLVNVAAFYDDEPGFGCNFEFEGYDAWLKVFQVNAMAPFFLAQSLHSLLLESNAPSIVHVSSIYGTVGPDHSIYEGTEMTNPCSYSVSKAGLNQLTKWLSTVLAPKIRVNTVSPGGIERGQPQSFLESYYKKTPLKRMCRSEEVADAILFLLSEQSAYITGHNLMVDGGWTVW
ncbi:MAG: SDR family oxidoreductase [Candidatus Berkiella sp.]